MNTDSPQSTSSGHEFDSPSDFTDWDSDEKVDDDFSYERASGKDDTDADPDIETDSENQDIDGNVRDISDDYTPTGIE